MPSPLDRQSVIFSRQAHEERGGEWVARADCGRGVTKGCHKPDNASRGPATMDGLFPRSQRAERP